jgi:hypothetical protein
MVSLRVEEAGKDLLNSFVWILQIGWGDDDGMQFSFPAENDADLRLRISHYNKRFCIGQALRGFELKA